MVRSEATAAATRTVPALILIYVVAISIVRPTRTIIASILLYVVGIILVGLAAAAAWRRRRARAGALLMFASFCALLSAMPFATRVERVIADAAALLVLILGYGLADRAAHQEESE